MKAGVEARGQAGSVLALVPAAFLVLILLAALAVDNAVAYQARQQLHDALVAAANDSVTAGLNQQAFYSGGTVQLDPASVESAACTAIRAQDLSGFHQLQVEVAVSGDYVRVTGSGSVDAVFGRAIPGWGSRHVTTAAGATVAAEQAPVNPPALPSPTVVTC
jgi:Flp pilus assembly protein TadG